MGKVLVNDVSEDEDDDGAHDADDHGDANM